jgi:hypothetical protein
MRVTFGDSVATATGFTVMRIRMDNPPGEVAVFSGNAHLERGNSAAVDLHGGESVTLSGTDPSRYNLSESIESDSWDSWNSDRDQALNAEAVDQTGVANNFVNNEAPNPAWNDLDSNGNWYNVPGQGYIWSPYQASNPGWDPYGCGHFVYTPRYGYIWVSCESWGYLPYSCGSWNYFDSFGWGWSPGMGMGMGCRPWWGGGGYGGINIGIAPRGYRPITRPGPPGPIRGRYPIIAINRGPSVGNGVMPIRARTAPVEIGGHTVEPMRPLPGNQRYERSQSGFVYHPSQGYRGAQTGTIGGDISGPRSNVRIAPGMRQGYTPAQGPQYTHIPAPPPPVQNNEVPGGNNGAPNPGAPGNNGGSQPMGGLGPRGYYGPGQSNARPNEGTPNPGVPNSGGGQVVHPWYGGPNSGGQSNVRPAPNSGNQGNNPSGSYGRQPSGGNTGGASNPRPSGANPGGGGGAPRGGGGGGGGYSGGGGAPRGGGGGAPAPAPAPAPHNPK